MKTLANRLPPLEALVAFEAAARHGSFTRAASELNVTQAAVSQRIRKLEEVLGKKLFEREKRGITLNAAGRAYQHTVSLALAHLAGATQDLEQTDAREGLVVAVDEAIGHLWLMPRLEDFRRKFEELDLRLIVSDRLEDCIVSEVDVAIVFGGEGAGGFAVKRMFREVVYPVCSKDYLLRKGPFHDLQSLVNADLIELEDDRWDWMNWSIWMTSAYGEAQAHSKSFQLGSYPLVVEAACRGLGVALGWGGLVDGLIEEGKLVRPLSQAVTTSNSYNILANMHSPRSQLRDRFLQWLASST